MRELRRKLLKGTDDEDAYEHVRRVLEIADLFHFLGVTHDVVMLRVFPITLKGPTLRWINRLSAGLVTTWDLLEKAFIRQYCPPFKTAKKLEIICNFKQEMDETLYHAWERYNDLLFKCPQQDLNNHQKVQIFYTILDISTRRMLDSKEFIPLMTPSQALKSIQIMAGLSHNWYDETITRTRKLSRANSNVRALKTTTKNLQEKAYQLTQTILTYTSEKDKTRTTKGKENVKEPVLRDLPVVQTYVPLAQFLGNPYRICETIYVIGIPEEIKKDEGDMNEGYDITFEDVERLRKILTPPIHALPNLKPIVQPYMPLGLVCNKVKVVREEEPDYDHVMQPLTPQTVHITPPDDDYVASATNPILNKHLKEFGEEFADNTRVSEKIDSNPVNDLKELLKTYDFTSFGN
ncbi:reverse transcriptase domain-containing protein [Tanacetum coccineum]|uniref:Reverse transcriptase domain-containing protein n=1 Tax=Tanacetum coccineum TaxID=301880 RepID=A0ABQ5B3A9_9ASTR